MLLREGAAAVRSAGEPVTPLQVAANRLAELPGAGKPSMQPKAGPAIRSRAACSTVLPGAGRPAMPLRAASRTVLPRAGRPVMPPRAGASHCAVLRDAGRPAMYQAGKWLAAGEFPTSIREKRVPDQQTCLLLTGIIPPGAIGIICWIIIKNSEGDGPHFASCGCMLMEAIPLMLCVLIQLAC